MPKAFTASEQIDLGPLDAEARRLGEWPVATVTGDWRLAVIDQVSIVIERIAGPRAALPPRFVQHDRPPAGRWNVLACGAAAPVTTLMLLEGARRVEKCTAGFEPPVLVCELVGQLAELGIAAFPAVFRRQEIIELLADRKTRIDVVTWYDIGPEKRTVPYLHQLRDIRNAVRPRCPIVALRPLPNASQCMSEWAAIRLRRSGIMAAAEQEYRAVCAAFAYQRDDDPNGYL
jgi:hypothetical protein